MGVSKNRGTTKSSILIGVSGVSIINHPFWGTPIFGNTHIYQSFVSNVFVSNLKHQWNNWMGTSWMIPNSWSVKVDITTDCLSKFQFWISWFLMKSCIETSSKQSCSWDQWNEKISPGPVFFSFPAKKKIYIYIIYINLISPRIHWLQFFCTQHVPFNPFGCGFTVEACVVVDPFGTASELLEPHTGLDDWCMNEIGGRSLKK